MFHKILVALENDQSQPCVFSTALRFAKANHAQLCLVDFSEDHHFNLRSLADTALSLGISVEIVELLKKEEHALLEVASNWSADLMVIAHSLHPSLNQVLPCTALIVQQKLDLDDISDAPHTISLTMQLKPVSTDLNIRNRFEKLLELTPSS